MIITKILGWIFTYAIIRALVSIGFGVVTYGAVIYALNNAVNYARDAYNGLPADTLSFLALAGVPEVLGIICGALIARATLQFAKKITLVG